MLQLEQRRKKGYFMLKIVIFDTGYGGELLADYLESELPVMDIVRIIDWTHADQIRRSAKSARRIAEQSLRPYINRVNLIIFADYFLTATSLKYFRRKYPHQSFIGLELHHPCSFKYKTHIFTTKALARTILYKKFIHQIKGKTVILDDWPLLIDDGELGHGKIRRDLSKALKEEQPTQIILACSQFVELEDEFRRIFGRNLKIINNFDEVLRDACHVLKIRGGVAKQK